MRKRPLGALGYTLYELIVALVLLGIALHPLISILAANARIATDRSARLDAVRVLRNEVAVLAAADPASTPPVRAYRTDRAGRLAPRGPFEVRTTRVVRCGIGAGGSDNSAAPHVAGCAVPGVVVDYQITVTFPRSAGAGETGALSHAFSVGARGPGGAPGALP